MARRRGTAGDLAELARLYGVQLWHKDGFGRRHWPGGETIVAVLNELGAHVERPANARDALRQRRAELAARTVEPVQVSWADTAAEFRFSLPTEGSQSLRLRLTLAGEDGYSHEVTAVRRDLRVAGSHDADGVVLDELALPLPDALPEGIYRCMLEFGGEQHSSTLLRAPVKAAPLAEMAGGRKLGLFLPAYAIRTGQSWGMGDYSDLNALIDMAGESGAGAVATLPLLPVFEDDPSPYSPVSRLAWNELYVDPRAAPEFETCEEAQRIVGSGDFTRKVAELEGRESVDYGEQFRLRVPVLRALSDEAGRSPQLREELESFAASRPLVAEYAGFRAACEKLGRPWQSWPVAPGGGLEAGSHFDPAVRLYHLNAQRLAFQQIGRAGRTDGSGRPPLFFDMPVGVRADGFDAWLKPELFANGMSAGAPPDGFFTTGQDWGFPPARPDGLRNDGYQYMKDALEHLCASAGVIRIDHVMGMHRLYWVPAGMEASEGAYVRYPAEEMYALTTIISHRSRAAVVGEDLGTVPRYVGPAMRRHGFHRMYAAYFNVSPGRESALARPDPDMFAYVDTHDMPPFAAFMDGDDISPSSSGHRRQRQGSGSLTADKAAGQLEDRRKTREAIVRQLVTDGYLQRGEASLEQVIRGLLKWLVDSPAAMTVANLEDLWLEKRPQNTPGTSAERPNWRGRSRMTLEETGELLVSAGIISPA